MGYARKVLARHGVELSIRRAWAQARDGRWIVLPAATDSPTPDSWWLGFDEAAVARRRAVGAILLCRKESGELFDFGLPACLLRDLAPDLSVRHGTSHRQFTVVARGGRFELMMTEGRSIDITPRLGDLSWLGSSAPTISSAGEPEGEYLAAKSDQLPDRPPEIGRGEGGGDRFFARFGDGVLTPLDPLDLEEGGVYLVTVAKASDVPATGTARRILARARPAGLPADFSEQHDHYARGAKRR